MYACAYIPCTHGTFRATHTFSQRYSRYGVREKARNNGSARALARVRERNGRMRGPERAKLDGKGQRGSIKKSFPPTHRILTPLATFAPRKRVTNATCTLHSRCPLSTLLLGISLRFPSIFIPTLAARSLFLSSTGWKVRGVTSPRPYRFHPANRSASDRPFWSMRRLRVYLPSLSFASHRQLRVYECSVEGCCARVRFVKAKRVHQWWGVERTGRTAEPSSLSICRNFSRIWGR